MPVICFSAIGTATCTRDKHRDGYARNAVTKKPGTDCRFLKTGIMVDITVIDIPMEMSAKGIFAKESRLCSPFILLDEKYC